MENLEFIELHSTDVDKNFLEILNQLDWTNKTLEMDLRDAKIAFQYQNNNISRKMYGLKLDGKLIAIGSRIKDYSIIHWPRSSCHIEDIAVHPEKCGFGYGKILMKRLEEICEKEGAYKLILSCSNHNIKFYKKCGYIHSCATMRLDFDKDYPVVKETSNSSI